MDNYAVLEDIIRKSFANVVWTHKIQEKQSDIYADQYKCLETVRIILAALTSGGIITTIFVDGLWLKIVSSVLSVATAFINSYFKSFDIQNMISRHKSSANSVWKIREDMLTLLAKVKMESDVVDNLVNEYQEIMNRLNLIYVDAPSTTDAAVKRAAKALNCSGDNTYSDDQIDKFLPPLLKKGK